MKYVLGGGLSGLIWAYYNPEYTVVTDNFGGFVDTKFGRAFVVLHETDEMVELFDELEIDCFVKELKIGYYDQLWGYVTRELHDTGTSTFARRYVEEKLPPEFHPGKDLELSAPGDEWRALFVDSSIIDALREEIGDVMIGRIKSLGKNAYSFDPASGDPYTVTYDEIVSTLPAPIFAKISRDDSGWDLKQHPTTYAELDSVPDRYRTKAWNVLYTVDDDVPYHRVIRNMLSSKYFVECLGEYKFDGDSITNSFGVIDDEDLEPPYDRVSFLGRYAEWQHDVRIDHVITRAREGQI